MTDLFSYAYRPDPFPASPGYRDPDTARQAARHVASRVAGLQSALLGRLAAAGANGLTADEGADLLGESVLSIRPRCSELLAMGKIRDSGLRRRNDSGRSAKCWVVA